MDRQTKDFEDKYWTQFGKKIAAPVIFSFCHWIKDIIDNDEAFSDILFVARDGYWPYIYFSEVEKFNNKVSVHYVYAPRSIVMSNSDEELCDYAMYIKKMALGSGKIAIVDTITSRFSAQKLILYFINNDVVGLYWTLFPPAAEIAKKEKLNYLCFQGNDKNRVPCWALMEFLFSAPERPIKAIRDGNVIYHQGNGFEDDRLLIFDAVSVGIRRELNEKNFDEKTTYDDIFNLLNNFYYSPDEADVQHFERIFVSDLPDHSDNYKATFFAINAPIDTPTARTNYLQRLLQRKKEALLNRKEAILRKFRTYRSSSKKLANKVVRYDIVSFDIFDTLVYRDCSEPKEIFSRLEHRNQLFDFAQTRVWAEQKARRDHQEKSGEVNIFDIYDILRHFYGNNLPDSCINDEVDAEKKACYANPYIWEVYNQCKKKGKIIIAVSDMYLPKELMKEILESCGYEIDRIFVSCDIHASKQTGKLQHEVEQQIGHGKRIVHIGDNYMSDYIGSRINGWDAVYIPPTEGGQKNQLLKK